MQMYMKKVDTQDYLICIISIVSFNLKEYYGDDIENNFCPL